MCVCAIESEEGGRVVVGEVLVCGEFTFAVSLLTAADCIFILDALHHFFGNR